MALISGRAASLPECVHCCFYFADFPGLEVISASAGMTVSAVRGNSVVFEKNGLFRCLPPEGHFSVTVLSLPDDASGTSLKVRKYGGVRGAGDLSPFARIAFVHSFGFLRRECIIYFCFTFDDSYTASCSIKFSKEVNFAPNADESVQTWTKSAISCAGYLHASDPEGDGF